MMKVCGRQNLSGGFLFGRKEGKGMESVVQGAFDVASKLFEGQDFSLLVGEQKMAYIGSLGPAKKVTREEFLQLAKENDSLSNGD